MLVLSDMADARHALRCIEGCDSQPLPLGQGCTRSGHMCHSPIVAGDQTAGPDATPQAVKIFSAATQRRHVRPDRCAADHNRRGRRAGPGARARPSSPRRSRRAGGRPFAAVAAGPTFPQGRVAVYSAISLGASRAVSWHVAAASSLPGAPERLRRRRHAICGPGTGRGLARPARRGEARARHESITNFIVVVLQPRADDMA